MWRIGGAAEARDAAALAQFAFDPEYREAWTEAQMAALLGTSAAWLNLGATQARLIAFALCRQVHDDVELLLCATHPSHRRNGLGRALVGEVLRAARTRGAGRLFLEVRASNDQALALYRATGFVECGRRPGYYRTVSGNSIDAVTLSHPL
jgi:ribosomal-protein-alanine N-acetyltransferase